MKWSSKTFSEWRLGIPEYLVVFWDKGYKVPHHFGRVLIDCDKVSIAVEGRQFIGITEFHFLFLARRNIGATNHPASDRRHLNTYKPKVTNGFAEAVTKRKASDSG
ncbi:MAG: hypothetical protein ABJB34_11675 [Acidobacteriota bacterium]